MCKCFSFLSITLTVFCFSYNLSSQSIVWQNTIGGNDYEWLSSMELTSDGNYIVGGYSFSNISGDKTENSRGSSDYWITKIDDLTGYILWQKTIGGSIWDRGTAVKETSDGGYIIGGYSNSNNSGEKSENSRGNDDYWVVKLDANRDIVWEKTYGGSGLDRLWSIIETDDGGYLMGGESDSNVSGEKNEASRGITDMWVIKVDKDGLIEWQKTYGGNQRDRVKSIVKAKDGGYLLAGSSQSNISGEKSENLRDFGLGDYWVLKVDNLGNILWQRTLGGDNGEGADVALVTSDGNFLIGGNSLSNISGEKTEKPICNSVDVWLIMLDNDGNILWDKTIGGDDTEQIGAIRETNDGGFVLGIMSYSGVSGYKTEPSRGDRDYWLVKLDVNGNVEFDKTIGGSGLDQLNSIVQSNDGNYVLGGWSLSNISNDKTENTNGLWDHWLVKLKMNISDYKSTSYKTVTVCEYKDLNLIAKSGVDYKWSGPNNIKGNAQNLIINDVSSVNAGIYNVSVYDASQCVETEIFNVILSEKPTINPPSEVIQCDFDNDGFANFDISNVESELIGNQTGLIVSYLDNKNNQFVTPLPSIYTNVKPNQEVLTLKVDFEAGSQCYETVDLILIAKDCKEEEPETQLVDYPKYFTPNNDGIHDYWQVSSSINVKTISIYNRYGKLIKSLNGNEIGWDGTFNGKNMPSSDYWFIVVTNTNEKIYGHFALKR